MIRRQYLAALGLGVSGSLAGCSGLLGTQSNSDSPLVDDRPDAVYVPTHVDGTEVVGMARAGHLWIALAYSTPHRFWRMDGADPNRVDVADDASVHLMASVWDRVRGVAIPSSNASVSISADGEHVRETRLQPMLSQNLGIHYGDNVALQGDGTYEVTVEFGPVSTRATGDFRNDVGEQVTSSFSFEFSQSALEEVMHRRLEDRQGEAGAVDPMEMEAMRVPQLPAPEELPGTVLGEGTSGDATFVATVLDQPPEGVDGSGSYLAVSARTPYNRFPLPFMSLAATLARDDDTIFEGTLRETIDPDLRYHYGAVVDGVEPGDSLTLGPQTPPQVSRHEGYETAFLDFEPLELGGA